MKTKYWSAAEVLNGIKERPAKMRRILGGKLRARFVVVCDGVRMECDTMPTLDKLMTCTYAEAPKVCHNWDNGTTINFDEKP